MEIKQASFVISVASAEALYETDAAEIAVAGKSNVGKSSFINFLTNQKKLAKTSSDPGRTRLLNYFSVNCGQFYFVDLPGYGFAKVAKSEKERWGGLIEGYLLNGKNLKNVFVLLDIRHKPSDDDKLLFNFLFHYDIPFTVIATKADKLSKLKRREGRTLLANEIGVGADNVIVTSASEKIGKDEVLERIGQIVGASLQPNP
jgi:GTP-binding protein